MTPNDRIEGWRALEDFTGMKEHLIRRAIGHYGFPHPVPESCFRTLPSGKIHAAITNVWFKPAVLIWIHLKNTIPTNHTIKQKKEMGYGRYEQNQCDGTRCESSGDREESPGFRR